MIKKNRFFRAAAALFLVSVILTAAFGASAADRDGFSRKDGVAVRMTAAAAEDGATVEVELVNEECRYAGSFTVSIEVPDGFIAPDAQTLSALPGESKKAEFRIAKAPETSPETAEETAPAGKSSGCGSVLPASAALAVSALLFAAGSSGKKKRIITLILAAVILVPALALNSGAAVTERSINTGGSFEYGGDKYDITLTVSYDYDFSEESSVKTTGFSEFGITYYWGPHNEQATDEKFWKAIAECGFTTVPLENNNIANNKIALGLMKKYGLTCSCLWDERIWAITASTGTFTDEQIEETVRAVVADYSEFDNIRGWWLYDEPSTAKFGVLSQLTRAFRKIDPEREVFIDLFPNYAKSSQLGVDSYAAYVEKYLKEVDPGYVCYDHYHFLTDSARRGFYSNFEQIRSASLEKNLDYMTIILLTKHNSYANVTRAQLRLETNAALCYGVKRISYFTFILDADLLALSWDNACMSFTGEIYPHYYDVQAVNAEILPLGRELFGKRSVGVYHLRSGSLEEGCTGYQGYGDLGEVSGKSFLIGFFDDGSFMIVNRKYGEGEYGDNSLTFIDVTERLEYFDVSDGSWKAFTDRDAEGRYEYRCGGGEGMLFRVG